MTRADLLEAWTAFYVKGGGDVDAEAKRLGGDKRESKSAREEALELRLWGAKIPCYFGGVAPDFMRKAKGRKSRRARP